MGHSTGALVSTATAVWVARAHAEEPPEPAVLDGDAEGAQAAAHDADVTERLRFIERRLDGEVASAEVWSWGWGTFNAIAGRVVGITGRLAKEAERLLRRNAHEAHTARTALPHVLNLALDVIGGILVWGVSDAPGTAWQSAGIGVAVGELAIWSQPTRAKKDLRAYDRQFVEEHARAEPFVTPALELTIVPLRSDEISRASGAALDRRF
jgi:hypothetical protein